MKTLNLIARVKLPQFENALISPDSITVTITANDTAMIEITPNSLNNNEKIEYPSQSFYLISKDVANFLNEEKQLKTIRIVDEYKITLEFWNAPKNPLKVADYLPALRKINPNI